MSIQSTFAFPNASRPARSLPPSTPWDDRVRAWEDVASSPVFARLAARVLERAYLDGRSVIVDLGAGTGLLSLPAATDATMVVAVDYSQPMLDRLVERAHAAGCDNVFCVRGDLREVPLPDAYADTVVSSYAFHHLHDAGKELALAEARRILRPGGRLVVCDMMFGLTLAAADRRIIASKLAAIARKGPAGLVRIARNAGRVVAGRWEHPASPDRWREMLEARRFADIEVGMVEHEAGIAVAVRPDEAFA